MGPEPSVPFVGRVSDGHFKFHRAITGRNSFLPMITGRIVAADNGAQLRMTLRLHVFVVIFEAFFVGTIVADSVRYGFHWAEGALIAALVGMTIGFFLQERHRALAILRREFDKG